MQLLAIENNDGLAKTVDPTTQRVFANGELPMVLSSHSASASAEGEHTPARSGKQVDRPVALPDPQVLLHAEEEPPVVTQPVTVTMVTTGKDLVTVDDNTIEKNAPPIHDPVPQRFSTGVRTTGQRTTYLSLN